MSDFQDVYADMKTAIKAASDKANSLTKISTDQIELFDGGGWYPIEFSRCQTYPEILDWVLQLLEKTWIEKDHVEHFLLAVFDRFPELNPRK